MSLDDFRRRHSALLDRQKEIVRESQNPVEFRTKWAKWKSDLVRLYSQAISEMSGSKTKKDKIIFLKRTFYPAQEFAIAGAVGCNLRYVFDIQIHDRKIIDKAQKRSKEARERRKHRGGTVSKKEREEVLKRDRHACVACGHKKNLEIHHIIPVSSFENTESIGGVGNLATLCRRCHGWAHGAYYAQDDLLSYSDIHEFWTCKDRFGIYACLWDVESVGKKTIDRLYQRFGSVEAIKKASIRDLTEIKRVSEQRARMIKSAFVKS